MLFFFLGVGGRWQQQQQKATLGHEPNCLCFLRLLKHFVLFYYTITDCFWERLTSQQTIPGFWVALLVHIKMSWKHFPLWCSYCLLSEAIPSEVRSNFADSWFLDVEHYEPPQLIWLEPVCTASSKKVTAGSCIFCNNAFSSILFVCIMQHGQSVNPVMQSLLALTQFL